MLHYECGVVLVRFFRGAEFKFYDLADCKHYMDDEEVVRDRWWVIQPGEVVLDVGAGFGSYALPAWALGAMVYALSPEADMGEIFEQNIALNGGMDRCRMYKIGFYNQKGFLAPASLRFSYEPIHNEVSFPVLTMDEFIGHEKIDRLDWIKIDVEGAEREVLQGGEVTIRRFLPHLLIENHLFKDPAIANDVRFFLEPLGYQSKTYPYHGISHSLYVAKHKDGPRTLEGRLCLESSHLDLSGSEAQKEVRVYGVDLLGVERLQELFRYAYRVLEETGVLVFTTMFRLHSAEVFLKRLFEAGFYKVGSKPDPEASWRMLFVAMKITAQESEMGDPDI